MDNKAMYKLSYGLFVLTTKTDSQENGCIINTAIQAASEPNTLSICVNKANYTHDLICESGVFNVSILSQNADFELFKRFGFQSGRNVNKFTSFTDYKRSENGLSYITKGANAYLSAKVRQQVDLGSHTMFLADFTDMVVLDDTPSVTYEYYQSQIKPKPQTSEPRKETVWRCKICNYEYVGEHLPEDFICPICKHPASDFEKL